tara:strand:+ start:219 stop:545 length:327 start_codon:yes stop_codon:yes gene_type:complete
LRGGDVNNGKSRYFDSATFGKIAVSCDDLGVLSWIHWTNGGISKRSHPLSILSHILRTFFSEGRRIVTEISDYIFSHLFSPLSSKVISQRRLTKTTYYKLRKFAPDIF